MKNLIQKLFIACLAFIGWGYPVCGVSRDLTSVVPQGAITPLNVIASTSSFKTKVFTNSGTLYLKQGQNIFATANSVGASCGFFGLVLYIEDALTQQRLAQDQTNNAGGGQCIQGSSSSTIAYTASYNGFYNIIAYSYGGWSNGTATIKVIY